MLGREHADQQTRTVQKWTILARLQIPSWAPTSLAPQTALRSPVPRYLLTWAAKGTSYTAPDTIESLCRCLRTSSCGASIIYSAARWSYLLNHPSWGNPSTTNINANGGTITGARSFQGFQGNTPGARFFPGFVEVRLLTKRKHRL